MLKWFNKDSTASPSSHKSAESQQYSQFVDSTLTESDYEFLFNQLLDGVAHGWHLGKIIKFFSNLEARGNVDQWIKWVERFEKKINYSADPSQKKVGAIMMRFGEITKPNDDLQNLGTLFYRIGNQLFVGTTEDLVWEYSGQDLVGQKHSSEDFEKFANHEQITDVSNQENLDLLNDQHSAIADPDSQVEFALGTGQNLNNSAPDQDVEIPTELNSPENNVAEQPNQESATVEQNLVDQDREEDVVTQDESSDQLLSNDHDVSEDLISNQDISSQDIEEDLLVPTNLDTAESNSASELNIDEDLTNNSFAEQPSLESTEQARVEEFSEQEDVINQAFAENLAAQYEAEQIADGANDQSLAANNSWSEDEEAISEEELIINQAFEENLAVRSEEDFPQSSLTSKFSPEEELINQAFEEGLAAQSKKSASASADAKSQDDSHSEVKARKVVLDLSLDLPTEQIHLDGEDDDQSISNQSIVVEDSQKESSEMADSPTQDLAGISDQDASLGSNSKNLELQSFGVNSTELEVANNKFSVDSFLEATEALSNNQEVTDKQVTVTWEEFVIALEQDPVLARNVAQQLGMVGASNPQDIVQAAVERFRIQKQAQLSPANIELVKSWFQLGLKQASAKDFQGAISSWDQALSLNPNLSEAWHNKGSALGRLGKYIEAIQSFDHAVRLDPESYQAWNDRAHALYKMQEWPKAIASWDRAIQIMPDRHQFWYNRGCALEQIKSFDESIVSYEKALEIKPDFQPARARHTVLIANNF